MMFDSKAWLEAEIIKEKAAARAFAALVLPEREKLIATRAKQIIRSLRVPWYRQLWRAIWVVFSGRQLK